MSTIINFINGSWTNIKNKCRTTVNKEYSDIEATPKFKRDLLISEHSPIRLLEVDWSWKGIPYWLSTEWSRHKFEKFISTQRTDRTGIDRSLKPQGALVNFDGYANAQNLIDVWRKRLCKLATKEAQELAMDFKEELSKNEYELSMVLVPNCVYRGGCPEFSTCGYWINVVNYNKEHENKDMLDIRQRYDVYEAYRRE